MNEVTLPPSPNWYLSNVLACASDGTVAWGARGCIVIAKTKDDSKILDYSIIDKAHSNRVASVAFSPKNEDEGTYRLVSAGDNTVKIWNLDDLSMHMKNSKLDSNLNVIGVDWSKHNPNLVCFVSEDGLLVTWNINYDVSQIISLEKLTATCLSCCPHDSNIVCIGSKSGLIYIVDIRGSGNITYKLRGHDVEIVSLSWCPVPINVFEGQDKKELLLASGAKDRVIFLWKAGTDGRYVTQITFPAAPLDISTHKSQLSASAGSYTAVCWLEPTLLLSSSPWGELVSWDLNASSGNSKKKFVPKLIHAKHGRGLFSIAGLAHKSTEQQSIDKSQETIQNWRTKTNIKAIWTLAQDRQVICYSLINNEPLEEYVIPTQGGFVYCMSACPVDTSQIAFGVGDAMIRLWNLSEPHETKIEIKMLWEKIKGKVRALSWHPEKENLLAFATNEGRVGVFDTNSKKAPILYRQYHRHTVYSIGWGPAPNIKDYALYSCGDGEIVYYNPEKPNNNPVSVTKKKECTEFSWKPDYSLLALGFGDGSISFLNRDLSEYGHTIHALNKAVQCLTWHPESTSSDLHISTMQNYLAVAINDIPIHIFEVLSANNLENKESNESFHKIVATLKGHVDKVVNLAWSPHMSGYLVSCSYDCTAQVWKVETQEIIATYTSHVGPLECCMWSPFSQDLIITGSIDFTLRIWSISKQAVLAIPTKKQTFTTKTSTKGKRTKRKKTKETIVDNNTNNGIEIKVINQEQTIQEEAEEVNKNISKIMKKKKIKKTNYFPGHSEITNNNKVWCSMVRNLLKTVEKEHDQYNESGVFDCNGLENSTSREDETVKSNEEIPILLGNKKNLENALNYEKKLLDSKESCSNAVEIDLWCGNLEDSLIKAMKNKVLNDFLISLAPTVSSDFWKKMCEAYAMQLVFEENPHKAVAYLLCINQIPEAVDVFINAKLYKEAYVLASSKLDPKDSSIENILRKWANNAAKDGHFQNAIECYVKLGEYGKAAKLLERRKDMNSLILAIDLAEAAKDSDLSASLADKACLEALLHSNIATAKLIIEKHPQIEYREIEMEVFSELNKILENTKDETIFNWLKGSSSTALLKTLSDRFTKCSKKYSLLLQKDVFPSLENEKMVQINVSHQLALSILSDQRKQQLQHIVKAFDVISQYEKTNPAIKKNKFSLLMKYLFCLDNTKLTDPSNIFNSNESEISESLRAYLCHTTINWFLESNLNQDQVSECINLIVEVLEKCVKDLLNKESVKFWTLENEINKLETQLSSTLGTIQDKEGNHADDSKVIIKRLDEIRNNKKQFLETRISSPNPLFSYGALMEFISKISNEETSQKINELVKNTWKKAIS